MKDLQQKGKVAVAMSGGVDSSVAAALLMKLGFEVFGITFDLSVLSAGAIEDAKAVAEKLNIAHYVVNVRDTFEKNVIDHFCHEYGCGRTPNPCVQCNRKIKFGVLLHEALALGADFLATGHYVRKVFNEEKQRYLLTRAADLHKDQTYMLYGLSQRQLKHALFPLGDFEKRDIRKLATELDLIVADKPESQEICFIEDDDYGRFLKERMPKLVQPGYFKDTQGNIVGKHEGVAFYTIGQRKGLGLALGSPVYVVDILPREKVVVVGKNEETFSSGLIAEDLNFLPFDWPQESLEVGAKIRYSASPTKAIIMPLDGNRVKCTFAEPQRAITPGQAVVFYEGDVLIGGGTIVKAEG